MNPNSLVSPSFAVRAAPTAAFGDLLVAVYDEASQYSNDPAEVSRMAKEVLARILRRSVVSRRTR